MKISFVVAMSENRVIGRRGGLPWHLPNDLKHFRALTLGKHVLMGRRTFDSIKKPLSDRHNLIMTRDEGWKHPDVSTFCSKQDILASGISELVVIGGAEIFMLFLPECQKIYLTLVHANIVGDTYFPQCDGFRETNRKLYPADEKHAFAYSFVECDR